MAIPTFPDPRGTADFLSTAIGLSRDEAIRLSYLVAQYQVAGEAYRTLAGVIFQVTWGESGQAIYKMKDGKPVGSAFWESGDHLEFLSCKDTLMDLYAERVTAVYAKAKALVEVDQERRRRSSAERARGTDADPKEAPPAVWGSETVVTPTPTEAIAPAAPTQISKETPVVAPAAPAAYRDMDDHTHPADPPRCPGCGLFALVGQITCGSERCTDLQEAIYRKGARNSAAAQTQHPKETPLDAPAASAALGGVGYPPDWPRCPCCGKPALDGMFTCGSADCKRFQKVADGREKAQREGADGELNR